MAPNLGFTTFIWSEVRLNQISFGPDKMFFVNLDPENYIFLFRIKYCKKRYFSPIFYFKRLKKINFNFSYLGVEARGRGPPTSIRMGAQAQKNHALSKFELRKINLIEFSYLDPNPGPDYIITSNLYAYITLIMRSITVSIFVVNVVKYYTAICNMIQ